MWIPMAPLSHQGIPRHISSTDGHCGEGAHKALLTWGEQTQLPRKRSTAGALGSAIKHLQVCDLQPLAPSQSAS